ncbi:trypsin-like peptidase domain-containing protein [Ostreiculturibacter nitratireducens]|uniref:trypsin-like peptidase domain-containing protein n=1 Tax=Ostreiculturibacter nitratireducens TaxID=3075226 RepID=UPI0031B62C9F
MHRPALLAILVLLAAPLAAETRAPGSADEIQLSFAPVVKTAAPAVVNIYATRIVARRVSPFADDPFFSQFFGFGETVPRVQNSLGSGVILSPDGIVVSNYHVVGDAEEIRVVLSDKREFDARVLLADADTDLAVIALENASDLPALGFADSDAVEVGDLVLAIGNPFGVGQTVTSGIVSGLARSGGGLGRGRGYFIQTDAAINPGNSGGALVDMHGRLVGINTSILTRSGGSEGIGFAIPANLVRQYVEAAEAGASGLPRPWAGIEVQPVDAGLAEALGLPLPTGAAIRTIHPDSPFAAAGLGVGDVITAIGGLPVDGPQELDFRLATLGIGAEAAVSYWHDGREETATIRLAAAPEADAPIRLSGATIFNGLEIASLSPVLIDRLDLPLLTEGVVVTDVEGLAQRTGLRPGDILVALNGRAIGTPADMADIVSDPQRVWQIEFIRGGQRAVIRIGGF